MEKTTPYAFGKSVAMNFEEAEKRVRELLAAEGFGIISEIDVKSKFAEKLKKEFRNYRILGACNPAAAYEVLNMDIAAGALLPCNVVLYDSDGEDGTTVMVMDPLPVLGLTGIDAVVAHVQGVAGKLRRVIESL